LGGDEERAEPRRMGQGGCKKCRRVMADEHGSSRP
jgi:hypothetical protein